MKKLPLLIAPLVFVFTFSSHGEVRTWTDSTGTHKIEAELVRIEAGFALLKSADGREIKLPVSKLSAEDQAFLKAGAAAGSGGVGLDWPQWRGPDRNDISQETGLLKEWPEGGPERIWLNEDGGVGYGGFSIVGGKLYTMGLFDAEEKLLCLDAATGKQEWELLTGPIYQDGTGDGPRSTPAVSGDFVYAIGAKGNVVCASLDGTKKWEVHFEKDLGGKMPHWGYSESPLVDGDLVIVTPGGSKGAVAALKKTDGSVVWQSKGHTEGAQYSSVIPVTDGGKKIYIQRMMNSVIGLDPSDGDLLWKTDFPGATAVVPTPIYKEGHVYVTAGYGVGCKMVKLDGASPREVYSNTVMVNHHGGVVLLGDYLYGHSDKGGWTCQDFMTGEAKWQSGDLGKGSITYADGMLYCLGEDGTMALVEATPDGYNEKGRFKLQASKNGGRVWVHPVVCNGRLYLRDSENISCFNIKAE